MIESSDTGQASTMFVGRDSFRMQVNDAGAVSATLWEGRTARVIDRRKNNRRQDRRVEPAPQEVESPAPPMPARNTIIGIALMTFACGVMVATAFNQFPMRGGSTARAAAATPAPQAPTAIIQPPANTAPAPVPAPVTEPVTAPIPVVAPLPEQDPQPQTPSVVAKAKPAAPAVMARAARPRRPAPSPATAATAAAGSETPPAAPRPTRKWVDPFAD